MQFFLRLLQLRRKPTSNNLVNSAECASPCIPVQRISVHPSTAHLCASQYSASHGCARLNASSPATPASLHLYDSALKVCSIPLEAEVHSVTLQTWPKTAKSAAKARPLKRSLLCSPTPKTASLEFAQNKYFPQKYTYLMDHFIQIFQN